MKRLWFKAKEIWWKIILGVVVVAALLIYFYRLLRPTEDKIEYLEAIKTEDERLKALIRLHKELDI